MALQTLANPFSSSSAWNTPIGSGATFQSMSGTETAALLHTNSVIPWIQDNALEIYQAKSTDPLATWTYDSRADTAAWQNGGETWGGTFQMRTPTNIDFQTSDGWAIIASEDGKHFYETWLGSKTGTNTYHVGYLAENDLTGTGLSEGPGQHDGIRAAGVSLLGGLVREQELNDLKIDHAIAMAISTTQAKQGSQASTQQVWPATSVDGFSDQYSGSIPMGALFAIPKSVDLTKIGITTAEGMALAKAYQNYGGYVVDTAGDRTDNLAYVETGATDQQIDNLRADMAAIRDHLAMITNNSAADPGGPGSPVGGSTPTPAPSTPSTPTVPSNPTTPVVSKPVPDTGTHTATTLGTGSDKLVLKISQDAYKGDAQYTISVDGHQVGGVQTAHASHAAGASDTVTVLGNWSNGNHDVAVKFVNDLWNGTAATDRNLHVDSASYNGVSVAKSKLDLFHTETQHFVFNDTTAPKPTVPAPAKPSQASVTVGSGSDQILLKISEDAYRGDAKYTVSVDGHQIGGVLTAHADHATGKSETVSVLGNWGVGDHKVAINFINDDWGGSDATDRNLHLDGATYNGAKIADSDHTFASNGAHTMTFHDYLIA